MDELLQTLAQLGFTEMESKCFIIVSQNKALTGYEVAKKLGASRSNVYASLQSLVEKGMVLLSKGNPSTFQAISFDELKHKIQHRVDTSLNKLEKHFPSYLAVLDDFFTLEGEKQVVDRIHHEISQAKEEIIVDFWKEEMEWFHDLLLQSEKRGIRVIGSILGKVDFPIKSILVEEREDVWQEHIGRKFSILIDRRVTVLGECHSNYHTKALMTKHPVMVHLLLNHFFHDLVIHEMKKDFGTQIEQRYGHHFENIADKYGIGWNTK